jgi:flagellar basal-body rod protein FlgB
VLRQPELDESTMLDRLNTVFEPHERALRLRAYRSEVLAGNIANADTPNYKARDFDFQAAYRGAIGQGDLPLTRTHAGHLGSSASAAAPSWLAYRHPVQPSIDGNTVELDAEVARYSENALRYQASLTFTSQRIRGLFSAIQGQ